MVLCFGRTPRLPLVKAITLTLIIFAGGCLGVIMAQVVSYNIFFVLGAYIGGIVLGNLISREFGL